MRTIIPAIMICTVCTGLSADTTGRIQGKVLTKSGQPIAKATITLKRLDIAWAKELKSGSNGSFMQIGLEPKEYEVTVSAEGFANSVSTVKIPLGDAFRHDVTLLTPGEAAAEAKASGKVTIDASAAAADAATEAYNSAVNFYNQQNFVEAMPLVEKAHASFKESAEKATDPAAKALVEKNLVNSERILSVCAYEVGKTDEAKRKELWDKAEPIILKAYQQNPKDQNNIIRLLDIANFKQDKEGAKKFQAELDAILGPRPESAYNQGVEAFNKGDMKAAKPYLLKAVQIDPKFADAYYLLAMCEFSDMNLKGTKENLLKYLELAPNGKNAKVAKDMLADPSLKKVK